MNINPSLSDAVSIVHSALFPFNALHSQRSSLVSPFIVISLFSTHSNSFMWTNISLLLPVQLFQHSQFIPSSAFPTYSMWSPSQRYPMPSIFLIRFFHPIPKFFFPKESCVLLACFDLLFSPLFRRYNALHANCFFCSTPVDLIAGPLFTYFDPPRH